MGLCQDESDAMNQSLRSSLTSKKYETAIGRINYFHLPSPYYSFGIKSIRLSENQTVLIASPEKAICDKIVLTSGIQLRSKNQTKKLLGH